MKASSYYNILFLLISLICQLPAVAEVQTVVGSPKGQFSVSPTGAATYTVPIDLPPGMGNMQPQIGIAYNSQAGMGTVGWGCSITGISAITRGPKDIFHDNAARGILYANDDAYYLDGKRLVLVSGTEGEYGCIYHPEGDPYTTVTVKGSYTSTADNRWFQVVTPDGLTCNYGSISSARQYFASGGFTYTSTWYVSTITDACGRLCTYNYSRDTANNFTYLSSIKYSGTTYDTSVNTVEFSYTSPGTAARQFRLKGVACKEDLLLSSITCKTDTSSYRTYTFQYNYADSTAIQFPRLAEVKVAGTDSTELPPLTLSWNNLPAFAKTRRTPPGNVYDTNSIETVNGKYFTSLDMDGDGLCDLIEIHPMSTTYNGNVIGVSVFRSALQSDGSVSFLDRSTFQIEGMDVFNWTFAEMLALDLDGNGTTEFLVPYTETDESSAQRICFRVIRKDLEYNGFSLDDQYYYYTLKTTGAVPLLTAFDLNGDGRHGMLVLEKKLYSGKYHGRVLHWDTDGVDFSLTLSSAPKRVFTGDYDGDGMGDLLVLTANGYSVFFNRTSSTGTHQLSDTYRQDGTNLKDQTNITQGDFNGDGFVDFAVNVDTSHDWHFYLNNGDGTFEKVLAATLNIYGQSTTKDNDKFSYNVLDFDHDGKSDIVMSKAMYNGTTFQKTHTRWLRSDGSQLVEMKSATSNKSDDARPNYFTTGDYDGDGYVELLNYGYDCYNGVNANVTAALNIYYSDSISASTAKVSSVTDGMENMTRITYAALTNPSVYTKGTGCTYPLVDLQMPLHVVNTVKTPTGKTGYLNEYATDTYTYEGLKIHQAGRGLLGFAKTTVTNDVMGTTTISQASGWSVANHFTPSVLDTRTTISGVSGMQRQETAMGYWNVTGTNTWVSRPSTVTTTDFDGAVNTTTYTYNTAKGVLTQEKTIYGGNANMYKQVTYTYGSSQYGGQWLPSKITRSQRHPNDSQAFSTEQTFSYNSKGLPTTIVNNSHHTALALTTTNTYNSYGNLTKQTVSGNGLSTVSKNYSYDSTNRFVTQVTTTPASTVTTCTYDLWGNKLTETDATESSNLLTTTNTYDGFGNLTSTTTPEGITTAITRNWVINYAGRTVGYDEVTTTPGQPYRKISYDRKGRVTYTEKENANGIYTQVNILFDGRGNNSYKSTSDDEFFSEETMQYDSRGRMTSLTKSYGNTGNEYTTTYSYTPLTAGNKTTTTDPNGRVYEKSYDWWGLLTQSKEPIGTASYTYKSCGKPATAGTAGTGTVTMAYDACGNQIRLTDPDAGTTTYTYNAAGDVISQTDARGITTTHTLDNLNRITQTTTGTTTTTYTYGTSGYAAQRLVSKTMGTNSISYAYDQYGRVSTETRTMGSTPYATSYEYSDSTGHLTKTTYPGNVQVTYGYNNGGYETSMSVSGSKVWEQTAFDGLNTREQLGTGTTAFERSTSRNSYGLLTGITLKKKSNNSVLHSMTFQHNAVTGNLTYRSGMIPAESESFSYDAVDRLTLYTNGHWDKVTQYAANGNIEYRTDYGYYNYQAYQDTSKPHAVRQVTNSGNLLFAQGCDITYGDFGKATVLDSDHGGIRYNISYGPDRERWYSEHYNGNMQYPDTVRYYVGDMEGYKVGPSDPVWFYHIGHGVVLRKVGNAVTTYYTFTDNLGSIMRLYNSSGTAVFSAYYDPWGVQTVTTNTIGFNRGYCGHEMLNDLQLINMNGRMYDPYVARFLSPDNYVQLPTSAQSFNRYSYCLNNPLKYVDLDGEVWWLVAGAAIGGIMNLATNSDHIHNIGDFAKYFGAGALAGAAGGYAGGFVAGAIGIGGAIGGAASGLAGGVVTGGILGGVNALLNGTDFWQGIGYGSLYGGAIGGIGGFVIGGITSALQGNNFWTGPKPTIVKPEVKWDPNVIPESMRETQQFDPLKWQEGDPLELAPLDKGLAQGRQSIKEWLSTVELKDKTEIIQELQKVGFRLQKENPYSQHLLRYNKNGIEGIRIRIDPPQNGTPYNHMHIDYMKRSYDMYLNPVIRKSPNAHIKIK